MHFTEKTKDAYANGLLKATEQITTYILNEINRIKTENPLPNSARQITNGGKLLAYNKMLSKLKSKRDGILSRNNTR